MQPDSHWAGDDGMSQNSRTLIKCHSFAQKFKTDFFLSVPNSFPFEKFIKNGGCLTASTALGTERDSSDQAAQSHAGLRWGFTSDPTLGGLRARRAGATSLLEELLNDLC
jgi:hypothetical protein